MATKGGRYCSFINCSNNTKTSVDSRTNKKLKFYSYPLKDTERCKKWIINSRRENVSLKNVANLLVCALHFERTQFNCPTDIANSRLLPAAVPTLVDCPNPPKTLEGKRKPPSCREYMSPKKKRLDFSFSSVSLAEAESECDTLESTDHPTQNPASKIAKLEGELKFLFEASECDTPESTDHQTQNPASKIAELEDELKFLMEAKNSLEQKLDAERKAHNDTKRENVRLKTKIEQLERDFFRLDDLLKTERLKKKEDVLQGLPEIPKALFDVLVNGGKRINWNNNPKALEISLAVFFKSPSAFSVIRTSGFILPHPKTLRARYQNVLESVGLCPKLLSMLKIRATALSDMEKHVTLALDGMKLKPGLTYDKHKDQLSGYEDFGCFGNSFSIADEAVVLMVRGLSLRWKQIIGYYVAFHSIKSETLSSIITHAVKEITNAGYVVDAVIMDQESSQWKWVDSMGVTPEKPLTHFSADPCFIIPDPPHLLKNLRNHLMTKDISFELEGMKLTAKWQYIKELHKIDSLNPTRLVPKLSDNHIELPRGKKMKVSLAAQVFSHTASAAMKTLVEKGMMHQKVLARLSFFRQ